MKTIQLLVLVIACLVLAGCGGSYGVSEYVLKPDGTFNIKSGKEMATVEAFMTRGKDGQPDMVYFNAKGVKAFEGQKVGAEIAKDVTASVREVLPQMVDAALKAYLGGGALEAAGKVLGPALSPVPPGVVPPVP